MRVQAADVILIGSGNAFLRLDNFQIISYAGSEAIAGLIEGLIRKIQRLSGNGNLVGGRIQIKQRGADIIVDLPAQILELLPVLPQHRLRLKHIGMRLSAGKDRNLKSRACIEDSM